MSSSSDNKTPMTFNGAVMWINKFDSLQKQMEALKIDHKKEWGEKDLEHAKIVSELEEKLKIYEIERQEYAKQLQLECEQNIELKRKNDEFQTKLTECEKELELRSTHFIDVSVVSEDDEHLEVAAENSREEITVGNPLLASKKAAADDDEHLEVAADNSREEITVGNPLLASEKVAADNDSPKDAEETAADNNSPKDASLKCDDCGHKIKGGNSQLKVHKKDHCKTKLLENLTCPICKISTNYNGLRYHLKYYNTDEKISKATKERSNHRCYSIQQHKELREKMVKKADKVRKSKSFQDFDLKINDFVKKLVDKMPKNDSMKEDETDLSSNSE